MPNPSTPDAPNIRKCAMCGRLTAPAEKPCARCGAPASPLSPPDDGGGDEKREVIEWAIRLAKEERYHFWALEDAEACARIDHRIALLQSIAVLAHVPNPSTPDARAGRETPCGAVLKSPLGGATCTRPKGHGEHHHDDGQGVWWPLFLPDDGGTTVCETCHVRVASVTVLDRLRENFRQADESRSTNATLLDRALGENAVLAQRVKTLEEDAARYRALRDSLYIVNLGANTNYYVSSDAFMDRMPDGVDGYADWLRSRALAEPTP